MRPGLRVLLELGTRGPRSWRMFWFRRFLRSSWSPRHWSPDERRLFVAEIRTGKLGPLGYCLYGPQLHLAAPWLKPVVQEEIRRQLQWWRKQAA